MKKMPQRFTKELLEQTIERDSATLIGEYLHINRETIITFKCKCGEGFSKDFRGLVERAGAFCKICTKIGRKEKVKATCIERFGTENPMKNEEIRNKAIETINNRTEDEIKISNEKRKKTNQIIYGGDAPACNKEIRERTIETNMTKYGTKTPLENDILKAKFIASNQEKYGVNSTAQLPEVKEKYVNTCIERYGVTNTSLVPEFRSKQIASLRQNYGVDYFSQSPIIQERIMKTNIKRYGVERPLQNQEVMERNQKNAKRIKEFVMPSGDIRKVQGYEPFALRKLLEVYTEDQLKTGVKNVPRIQYEVNGKKRYHFPDIFIPHENKLVEVKSTWTFKNKADNVLLKKKTAEEQGFLYEIWCFDGKGNRVEV